MSASLTQNKNATPTHAHTFDREEATTYLDLIFGQKPAGFFALAFKVLEPSIAPRADREFNDYITIPHKEGGVVIDHFGWAERKFAPHEREEMFREIESRMAADLTKVMISLATYTKPTKRYLDNIKQIRVVHIDFDAPDGKPMDPELYALLLKARPVITASGSPNRFHGYIGVRNLTIDDHYTLEWAIRDKFNGDNKIKPNDLLTLPGTYNIKDPDDPQPVRLLTGDRRLRMWSCIEEVAELLDLDLSSVPPRAAEVGVGTDESLDDLDAPVMRRLKRMAQQGRSGHSEANFGIVKDCKELGLTPGQTYTFITTMMGSAEYKEKGDDWLIGDIARIWDKPGKKDMKKATQNPKAGKGSSIVNTDQDDLNGYVIEEADDDFTLPASLRFDFSSMLDGTFIRKLPSILNFGDDRALFYPGLTHWIFGAAGTGKSFLGMFAVIEAVKSGKNVVYLDYEMSPHRVLTMLMSDLGVEPDLIAKHFIYHRVEGSFLNYQAYNDLLDQLLDESDAELVVIDGVNQALQEEGLEPNDVVSVGKWIKHFPNRAVKRTGAAVICIDHANQQGNLLGSVGKRAGLTGTLYKLEVHEGNSLGKNRVGILNLECQKDREGSVLEHAQRYYRRHTYSYHDMIARITVMSDEEGHIKYEIAPAPPQAEKATKKTNLKNSPNGEKVASESKLYQLSTHFSLNPKKAFSKNQITDSEHVSGNKQDVSAALEELIELGCVEVVRTKGPYPKYRYIKAYETPDDAIVMNLWGNNQEEEDDD